MSKHSQDLLQGLQTGPHSLILPPAPHTQQVPNTLPPNGPLLLCPQLGEQHPTHLSAAGSPGGSQVAPPQTPMGPVFPPLQELLNESRSLHSKALFHILMVFPLTLGLCLVCLFGAYSLVQTPRHLIPPLIPSLEQLRGFPLSSRKRPWSDESLWGPALVCLCSHFPSSLHSGFRLA